MKKYNIKTYYSTVSEYPTSNKVKAKLGEEAFAEALSDYPVIMNITYGKRQKDIDHLVLTSDCLVFNECKNVNENFHMFYSWSLSHVVDRFSDGLPIAQYYGRTLGYSTKNIVFTLTIPRLNTEPIIRRAFKGVKIHVIETSKQLLDSRSKREWYNPIRKKILSVINIILVPRAYLARISQNRGDPRATTFALFDSSTHLTTNK